MECRWLVSLVILATWACLHANGRTHHTRVISHPPGLLPSWTFPSLVPTPAGLDWELLNLSLAIYHCPSLPQFPAYPSLKESHSVSQIIPWMLPPPALFPLSLSCSSACGVGLQCVQGSPSWPDDKLLRAATPHPERCPAPSSRPQPPSVG